MARTTRILPHFEVRDGNLYWIEAEKEKGEEVAQVLVPQRYQLALLQIVHAFRMDCHLGRDKTEVQLAQCLYWPGLHK